MKIVENFVLNNKTISYVRYGEEWKETAVLFFHGFTGSKNYIPDMEEFADLCIISFDRPGIGESDVQKYYTMEEFFIYINAVLDYHGVKKLRLIGHSAGGYYAQVYAQQNPSRVEALALVSSMVPYNCDETKNIIDKQIKQNIFFTLHMKLFSKYIFKQISKKVVNKLDIEFVKMLKTLTNKEKEYINKNAKMIKQAILNATRNNGLGIYYDAFSLCQKRQSVVINQDIPVVVWNGTNDTTTPVAYANYLANKYKAKKIHLLDEVGHMMYLLYWKDIVHEIVSIT